MNVIERLREVATSVEDGGCVSPGGECLRGDGITCRSCLADELYGIADQMEDEHGRLEKLEARLMPEGWDGEFIKLHLSNLWGFMFDVMDRLGVDTRDSDAPEIAIDALDRRLMPEGMEWPTVDGKPVVIGERMRSCGIDDCKVVGIDPANSRLILASDNIEEGKATYFTDFAEYCHRPMPKVLDADGAEIRVGDTVYEVDTGEQMWVCALPKQGEYSHVKLRLANGMSTTLDPCRFTHRAPVLAADGKPLREGEAVWSVRTGERFVVSSTSFKDPETGEPLFVSDKEGSIPIPAKWVTHERPDSWERLEEDARLKPSEYTDRYRVGRIGSEAEDMRVDLVRRCRVLAERERGE